MDFFGTLMWPIKYVLEAILAGFHWVVEAAGVDGASGLAWVLAIVGLVLVVRTAMIPLTVKQIVSSRRALEVAPEVKRIQDKYKGKKDQFSREAMQRETMAAYKKAGTNPLASCLPMLVQMPVFFGLVTVLTTANRGDAGVGFMTKPLADQFGSAQLFDVIPLHMTMQQGFEQGNWYVVSLAILLVVIMTGTQFFTQLQIMSKNQTPAMKESPMYRQQRVLLYIIPIFLIITGYMFPLATMFYWLVSNIFTMVQQFIIIHNMPTPGSDAALAREARLARKRQRQGLPPLEDEKADDTLVQEIGGQRVQPKRKTPKSKRGGK
ncbi:membrane protein insertase YidC [Humidisolicoccus flavus]|uniref:membrane protein insertase YidC n=1 Tax=Humidisolicoccus flavus TaxID=3111414 RepID=UPI0032545971